MASLPIARGLAQAETTLTWFRESLAAGRVSSQVRNPRTAVVIGRLLALAFGICFLTGLYSHFQQDPLTLPAPLARLLGLDDPPNNGILPLLSRPVWFYRLTQGLHVTTGLVSVPLLLAKLWTVYPKLFTWPPLNSWTHAIERILIAVLVAASLLEVVIGVMNIYHWYSWPFSFRTTHFPLAWVIVGALLAHIGFRLPTIAAHWTKKRSMAAAMADEAEPMSDTAGSRHHGPGSANDGADSADAEHRTLISSVPGPIQPTGKPGLDRRAFFATVTAAAAGLVVFTAGQSTRLFSGVNLFGPRIYGDGPQGLPVNRTAAAAGVLDSAVDPDWRLRLTRGAPDTVKSSWSLDELRAFPQVTQALPISCVEGWSTMAEWTGVRLSDLLAEAGIDPTARLRITSLQTHGGNAVSEMGPEFTSDPATLVALKLGGEVLDLDHGYPARIISPGRPGVLQTKWISTIEVIS